MKQKYQNLEWQIKNNHFSMGFGGKHTFRKQYHLKENGYWTQEKWYHDYVKARDKNIFYLGSVDESAGNQMFQMSYNEETDDFSIKIRKEKNYCKSKDKTENYIRIPHINFQHLHEELVNVVREYTWYKINVINLHREFIIRKYIKVRKSINIKRGNIILVDK